MDRTWLNNLFEINLHIKETLTIFILFSEAVTGTITISFIIRLHIVQNLTRKSLQSMDKRFY